MKSDIKLIIESLYDLGVIQRKKRRKKKVKKLINTVRSSGAPMSQNSSIPSLQETPFRNTSNLQNEYLREQLLTLENSNAQKPQFRELENQIEDNRIFQNQTQRALLYLHNQSDPIIEEIGYDNEDNIDVTSTGSSDIFDDEEVSEPVNRGFFGAIGGLFSPNPSTPKEMKSFMNDYKEQMADFEASPNNSDFEEGGGGGRVKRSYKDNRETLRDIYKEKGGYDPKILSTTTKKTIEGAIKNLDDLAKYKSLYANVLGGDDESLIDGDITILGKLKAQVKERIKELNKGKKDKTSVKELLSRH